MEEKKVYANKDKEAIFICAKCNRAKTVNVSHLLESPKAVKGKMKCVCGHAYRFILERRKFFRKSVNLKGLAVIITDMDDKELFTAPPEKGSILTAIQDISRSGLKLKFNQKPDIQVGDTLVVEFHLDNREVSLIRKEVVVRNIIGNSFGVEFVTTGPEDQSSQMINRYLILSNHSS